jgi:hypothetical protein
VRLFGDIKGKKLRRLGKSHAVGVSVIGCAYIGSDDGLWLGLNENFSLDFEAGC